MKPKASLNVNFEKLNYICGEQVNGTISQIVNQADYASCIQLKLKGKEKVIIKDWESGYSTSTQFDGNGGTEDVTTSHDVQVEYRDKKSYIIMHLRCINSQVE